ncbi:MAG: hypothetical protein QM705_12375 [Ancrocorticia sp.]
MSINSTLGSIDPKGLQIRPVPSAGGHFDVLEHSELRKIAESVLGGLKYSFAAAAADPAASIAAGGVGAKMAEVVKDLDSGRQEHYAKVASGLVSAPEAARVALFGAAGELEAEAFVAKGGFKELATNVTLPKINKKLFGFDDEPPVSELLAADEETVQKIEQRVAEAEKARLESGVFDHVRLADIWGARTEVDPFEGAALGEKIQASSEPSNLGLWITEIKCVDETDPEFWGDDEIALAGVEIDEDGDTRPINEIFIGKGFRDRTSRTYPNWRYVSFSMDEGQYWPKRYTVSFLLAEKDNEGLQKCLNDIWGQIRDKVKIAITAAVGGAVTPVLGPIIGAAIGWAVAWVVDQFVRWIIGLFGDDIFPIQTVSMEMPSKSARWYYSDGQWGNPASGIGTASFYGHGGHYQLKYQWRVHG